MTNNLVNKDSGILLEIRIYKIYNMFSHNNNKIRNKRNQNMPIMMQNKCKIIYKQCMKWDNKERNRKCSMLEKLGKERNKEDNKEL